MLVSLCYVTIWDSADFLDRSKSEGGAFLPLIIFDILIAHTTLHRMLATIKPTRSSAKKFSVEIGDAIYEIDDDNKSYGDISDILHEESKDGFDDDPPEPKPKISSSKSRRYTTAAFFGDEESPSTLSFMVPSREQIERAKRTRMCYWLCAVLSLALFGFGIYAVLYVMGWLPSVEQHKDFQGTITSSELTLHDSPDDCWVVYYDKVYVMTDYAFEHPGGSTIITNLCGTDGTGAYEIYHPKSLMKSVQSEFIGDLVVDGASAPDSSSVQAIQMVEVESHNTKKDCWVVYYNQVYDLTDYDHPGGQSLVTSNCGGDGTASYSAFHPESLLATVKTFAVGDLVGANSLNTFDTQAQQQQNNNHGGSPDSSDSEDSPPPPVSAPAPNCMTRGITLAEVEQHASAGNCWSIYHDKVYDMTNYQHPRQYVTSQCGRDGTGAFDVSHPMSYLGFVGNRQLGVLSTTAGDAPCI